MALVGDGRLARLLAKALGEGLKERFPIGAAVIQTLGPAAIEAIAGPNANIEEVAGKLEKVAAVQPQVVNNLNLESPLQSGTTWGNGITLVAVGPALGLVIWQYWQTGAVSQEAFIALFGLLFAAGGGAVFSLARRWLPNLKPLGK